jgi:5'-nucleotidase
MTHIEKKPGRPIPREGDRAWILFSSGSRLNLLAPSPNAWTDEDLATGLSRTYRWSGHSSWDLPLSVAQHSLTVLALR